MTEQNFDLITTEEDYEFVKQGYDNGLIPDVLSSYEELGYTITSGLVEELIEINEFQLNEEKKTTIRFFVDPDEKNDKFARVLTEKVNSLGRYRAIALAYRTEKEDLKQEKEDLKQEKENLFLKRVTLQKYVAIIARKTELINCKTIKEIEEFDLTTPL
jgi:hypothetical protein